MIYNFKLNNGIRCIFKKIDGIHSISAGILVGVGSAYETKQENGISHFIEHMNFKGTEKRSSLEISEAIDDLGAQINAYTGKEYTCFYIKAISEHLAEAFEILSDLFINATYEQKELEREKGVVVEEIKMYEDTPDELCNDLLANAFYGESGYGATVLGSEKNVKSFSREDILCYKQKYYTTDNIVLSFAGAGEVEQIKDLCEKYLGGLHSSSHATFNQLNTVNLSGNKISKKDIEQVHFALALDAVNVDSPLYDSFYVISNVLGGGMSSRLFQTVREKLGLAYSTYCFNSCYKNCGYMTVYAGVSKDNYRQGFDAVMSEIKNLKQNGISENEFRRTREQMKSSIIMAEESSSSQMNLLGKTLLVSNRVFDINDRIKRINDLILGQVNETILSKFNVDRIATAIVGQNVKVLQ